MSRAMLIVQKYGGTSVADADRIRTSPAGLWRAQGGRRGGVSPAMAGRTNRLLKLTSDIATRPSQREQDVVVSTGGAGDGGAARARDPGAERQGPQLSAPKFAS